MPKIPIVKAGPIGKKTIQFVTKSTSKPPANTLAVKMSTSVRKPTPVVETTNVQDKNEHVIISTDNCDIMLTEEEIDNLSQDTFSGNKGDYE